MSTSSSSETDYEIVSVMPAKVDNIDKKQGMKIEVMFDKAVDIESINGGTAKQFQLCQLVSSSSSAIYPHKLLHTSPNTLLLFFSFD